MSDSLRSHGLYPTPGSSVHGILQARTLEWVTMPFSGGSFQPRDRTRVSCIADRFFTIWATRETPIISLNSKPKVKLFRALISWFVHPIPFSPSNTHLQFTLEGKPNCLAGNISSEVLWLKPHSNWCPNLKNKLTNKTSAQCMPGCYVCVFVSCFSWNKLPSTEWFKTTEMSCLSVLEVGGLNLRCGWGHAPSGDTQGDCPLLFQPLGAPSVSCGHITPISASAATCLLLCMSVL